MKKQIVGRWYLLVLLLAIILLSFCIPNTVAYVRTDSQPPKENKQLTDADLPRVLLDISWCESRDRQFNADGTVHRGEINPQDVGRWQINEHYWLEKSRELGFDIYTEEGNRAMALWIYNNQGVKPWSWSAGCHGHY